MVKKAIEKTELRPDFLVKYIEERKAELEQILIEKNKALEDAPDGKLRIERKGNSLQYYHRKDPSKTKGFYLKRAQDSFAATLAQKEYDFKLISELNAEIKALTKFLDDYRPEQIDELFVSLHDYRKCLIRPAMLLDEDYVKRWMSVEYEKKSFEENAPDYYTVNGERVRSKSELIIADALNRFKIPYRYEYSINIYGIGTVHPDFVCLNVRMRKEYVWEHNGMMSNSEYADHAVNKIEKYTLAGYCPGENLILSFETSSRPLSSRIIEYYINRYLL
jgi:hypothetical protein